MNQQNMNQQHNPHQKSTSLESHLHSKLSRQQLLLLIPLVVSFLALQRRSSSFAWFHRKTTRVLSILQQQQQSEVEAVKHLFEKECTLSNVGKIDQTIVYGDPITYCFPRGGFFQSYLNATTTTTPKTMQSDSHFDDKKPTQTIIVVTSPPQNIHRRWIIRNAWGAKGWVLFVIASNFSHQQGENQALVREMNQHGDVLLVHVPRQQDYDSGTARFMASLHALQTHLSGPIHYQHVVKVLDSTHVHIPMFHYHLTQTNNNHNNNNKRRTKPKKYHYYGICLPLPPEFLPRTTTLSTKSMSSLLHPPLTHSAHTGVGPMVLPEVERTVSLTKPNANENAKGGLPTVVASSVGYALSVEFITCILNQMTTSSTQQQYEDQTKKKSTMPWFLQHSRHLHEDVVVALLAHSCRFKCTDSAYEITKYLTKEEVVVQHKVKTVEEMKLLQERIVGSGIGIGIGSGGGEKD